MAKNTTKEAAYTPTVWADGDTITADKLNKLEEGVENQQVGPTGPKGDKGDTGAPGPITQAVFDALVARVAALESAK